MLSHKSVGRKKCCAFALRFKDCVKSVRIRSYSGPYSVRMLENTDQNNSEYEHFLRSEGSPNSIKEESETTVYDMFLSF